MRTEGPHFQGGGKKRGERRKGKEAPYLESVQSEKQKTVAKKNTGNRVVHVEEKAENGFKEISAKYPEEMNAEWSYRIA